ncbi:MAG: hypothetical protein LBQ38_09190 [Spirochaetaceae bacterium]|jgi:hypothetical protein|nr:hypothetical protein [Spirochaetaceae bacterium]
MMNRSQQNGVSSIRAILLTLLLIYPCAIPGALEVDTSELNKSGSAPVVFINYEGPHARIETRNQIRNIGFVQGSAILSGALRSGSMGRYFVFHSVTGPEDDRLDADIFGLGVDVGVDHIKNLRLIIQGYLEGAYNYSPGDAALLAEYITVYNAVFRGSWDYFSGRYKTPVLGYLDAERVGLSIRFDEWPGRTLMLIPLALGTANTLSAVDTGSLTNTRVIDEIRTREDMGIERRQEMVDLKEREAEQAEQRAVLQREAIAEDESRMTRERSEAAAEREAIAREQREVEAAESSGQVSPEEAREAREELARRETEADKREGELEEREAALETRREEAQKTEEFAEQKIAEAQQERQDIARDQQEIINLEDRQGPSPVGIIALRINGPDSPLGRILRINPDSGAELRASPLETINVRTLIQSGERLLAVAGENRGSGAIRLVEINSETLEMDNQGADDIHPQSLLWVNGESLYAITVSSGSLYLGRFNTDLVLEARSNVTVHPYGTPNFQGSRILIQRADGTPLILDGTTLSEAL